MAASPSPLNYFEGSGNLWFTPVGGTRRHLGNAPSVSITPNVETRPHFESMSGNRQQDRVDVTTRSLSVAISLEEITPENLGLSLMGTVYVNSDGNKELQLLSINAAIGRLEIIGTNSIGNRFTVDCPSVSFIPGEGFDFIGTDLAQLSVTGEVNAVDGSFGTLTETAVAGAE